MALMCGLNGLVYVPQYLTMLTKHLFCVPHDCLLTTIAVTDNRNRVCEHAEAPIYANHIMHQSV
jgi:hypothetical protein